MAKCPACGHNLKIWNFKAECPKCGVNIPNHNWEERLEQDAVRSEWAFAKLRRATSNLKSGLFGSKLSITRFVFTFAPLIALVIPMFRLSISIPFYSYTDKSISVLNIILSIVNGLDIGSLLKLMKSEIVGGAYTLFIVGVLLVAVAVVAAVINFFVLIIGSVKHKYTVNMILCSLSAVLFIAAIPVFSVSFGKMSEIGISAFGGQISIALFVGILLFAVNLVLNIITSKHLKKIDRENPPAPLPPKPTTEEHKHRKNKVAA